MLARCREITAISDLKSGLSYTTQHETSLFLILGLEHSVSKLCAIEYVPIYIRRQGNIDAPYIVDRALSALYVSSRIAHVRILLFVVPYTGTIIRHVHPSKLCGFPFTLRQFDPFMGHFGT